MKRGIMLVTRDAQTKQTETHIRVQQGFYTWTINPCDDISRAMGGRTVSRPYSVTDFLSGLKDAGFQVIIHRKFADETPYVCEHVPSGPISNPACYLYGLAFGLNQWDEMRESMRQFQKTRMYKRNPYFHNEMRILKKTGEYYATNAWQARLTGQITLMY